MNNRKCIALSGLSPMGGRWFKLGCLLAGFVPAVAVADSVVFTNVTTAAGMNVYADQAWGSPVWGDLNNDGYVDAIVPNHTAGPRTWINNGNGTFTLKTSVAAGMTAPSGDTLDWHGFALIDFNNDGKLDLHVTEGAKMGAAEKTDLIYLGDGTGKFVYDINSAPRFNIPGRGRTGVWFDYDLDGWVDLFQKNYQSTNIIYINQGGDNLVEHIGAAADFEALTTGSIMAPVDYNLDGLVDLFITGMGGVAEGGFEDTLFKQEASGTFVKIARTTTGIVTESGSRGMAWGDYDNDGDPDLMLARGFDDTGSITTAQEDIADRLFRNNGNGTFTDVTVQAGLPVAQDNTWSVVWGDLDNDGWLDLIVPQVGSLTGAGNANRVYQNNRNGTFTEIGVQCGLADQVTSVEYRHMGAAVADYDNNGFLDVLIKCGLGRHTGFTQLFRNGGNTNRYLTIKLVGTHSNTPGLGATVMVDQNTTTPLTQTRQYFGEGGGNLYSQSAAPLHFGVGAATVVDVTVKWPSGIVQTLSNVTTNQILTITEATQAFSVIDYSSIVKDPQKSLYVLTVLGTRMDLVQSATLETSPAAIVKSITVVNAGTLAITVGVAPGTMITDKLNVTLNLSGGETHVLADAFYTPKTYAVTLPAGVIGYEDVVYGTTSGGKNLMVNIYRPEVTSGPLPVILWIHGGAFKGGSRKGVMPRILEMTTMGYAVVSLDYSLVPEYMFDAPVEDCKAAVRFLRANATTYGLDPNNIGTAGGSSGGYLAAFLGTSGGIAAMEESHGNHGYSSRVKAVCVLYGGTDLVTLAQIRGLDETSSEAALLGVAPLDNIELATYASPATHVSADDAPSLLLYGEFDTTAPAQQGQLLHDRLTTAGVESELQILPYGHDFPADTPEMNADMYAFFDRHLKAPPEVLGLTGVSPSRLVTGQTVAVTVSGTAFAASDMLTIGPAALGVRIASATYVDAHTWNLSLVVSATATLGKRDLVITNAAGTKVTAGQIFSVEAASPPVTTLTLAALTPGVVEQGKTADVVLTGTGLTSGLTLTFAPTANGVRVDGAITVAADGKSATFKLAASAVAMLGKRDLVVTLSSGATATLARSVEVIAPAPVAIPLTASGLTPASLEQGKTVAVRLTGTGFTSGLAITFGSSASGLGVSGAITVSVDGTTADFSIVATDTATVGSHDLVITAGTASATLTQGVAVTAKPVVLTVQGLANTTIKQGQTLTTTLTGTGFTSSTVIVIGPSALGLRISTQTFVNDTSLQLTFVASSTAKIGARDFTLSNPDGSTVTRSAALTVTAP